MVRLLTMIGLAAAAVLIGASATMNYMFASSLGKTPLEGYILGTVSVSVDVLKALLAVFVAKALREGQRGFVIIGGGAFLLFAIGSFVAAAGFASSNRGAVTETRRAAAQILIETEQDLVQANEKRAALPSHRPAPMIEAAIAALHIDARWKASQGCAAPSTTGQRELCAQAATLRVEFAAAREALRLDDLIVELRKRISVQRHDGGGEVFDPQARLFAQTLGLDETTVQRLLMSMVALVVEVSSALGIYLVTGHEQTSQERPKDHSAGRGGVGGSATAELHTTCDSEVTTANTPVLPDDREVARPRARASIALAKGRSSKPG